MGQPVWLAASAALLSFLCPGEARADPDDFGAICAQRREIRAAHAGADAQLIVSGDGQLSFHGLPTTSRPSPGRRLPDDRYLARYLTIEIDPTLVADDDTYLRIAVRPPSAPERVLGCDVINPLGSGRTAYQVSLPIGLSPRSVMELQLFRRVDPGRDAAEARREYDRAISARRIALAASLQSAAPGGAWEDVERRSIRWDLTHDLRQALDTHTAAPTDASTRALQEAFDRMSVRLDRTKALYCAPRVASARRASPVARVVCQVTRELEPLQQIPLARGISPQQLRGGVAGLRAILGQPTAPPPLAAPSGYCESMERLNWLAASDRSRLFVRGRVPYVTDQDTIETREMGRGDISTTLSGEATVGVVIQRVSTPSVVSAEIEALDASDPVARSLATFFRYAIGAAAGPAPDVGSARSWCELRDDDWDGQLGLRVDDGMRAFHPLETHAMSFGRVPSGRQAVGRLCDGSSCVTEGAGANVRQTMRFRVEPDPHFVVLVAPGLTWSAVPPSVEFEPLEGATGPDQAFRVVDGSLAPSPSVSLMAGVRFCQAGFVGFGTSIFLDGFDALHHWFLAAGFRIPSLTRAVYLLFSAGLVFADRLEGYEVGQVVSVPRAAMGETAAPNGPSSEQLTLALGVHLGFDLEALGDLATQLVEAIQ